MYLSSYEEMLKCWEEDAEKRPSFSQLVTVISTILEEMAGYLDLGSTPSAYSEAVLKSDNTYCLV